MIENIPPQFIKELLDKHKGNLFLLPQTTQLRFIHTKIRDRAARMKDFLFFSDRLIRLIVEEALCLLPVNEISVITHTGSTYNGVIPREKICGISIMRAGESMESALREVCMGGNVRIGKILIQRDETSKNKAPDPKYSYAKLPQDVASRQVLLMDPMLATGGSINMAIEVLINKFQVKEENIIFMNVICCPEGIHALLEKHPKVRIVTSAIDNNLNDDKYILPGLGDFGDRYFGTV